MTITDNFNNFCHQIQKREYGKTIFFIICENLRYFLCGIASANFVSLSYYIKKQCFNYSNTNANVTTHKIDILIL